MALYTRKLNNNAVAEVYGKFRNNEKLSIDLRKSGKIYADKGPLKTAICLTDNEIVIKKSVLEEFNLHLVVED